MLRSGSLVSTCVFIVAKKSDSDAGTGVSLYAMFPTELPHNDGQATYSIDGGPTTTFTIPGGGDISVYNRKIFEVTGLSKQDHTIVITYTSTSSSTPLVISQLFIEGGTNQRASASGSGGGSPGGGASGGGSTSITTTSNPNTSTISVADPSTNTSAAVVGGTALTSRSTTSATDINAAPSDVAGSPTTRIAAFNTPQDGPLSEETITTTKATSVPPTATRSTAQ